MRASDVVHLIEGVATTIYGACDKENVLFEKLR